MADTKTSDETTGGTLKDADLLRYSEEASGLYSSKKKTMSALKTYVRTGINPIFNEVPSIDVTRTILTFANNYVAGSIRLFVGGVRMKPTVDFTETAAAQITMTSSIPSGVEVVADYNT